MLGKTNITTLSEGAIVTEVEDFKWIQMQSGVYGNFVKAIYKNDYLVAITADGTVVYTTDGEVWQASVLEYENCKLNDIEWDGSRFLFAGSYSANNVTIGLILATSNFDAYEMVRSDAEIDSFWAIYSQNGKYLVLGSKSSDMKLFKGTLTDEEWEGTSKITSYYNDASPQSIVVGKNTNGMMVTFMNIRTLSSTLYNTYYIYQIINGGFSLISTMSVTKSHRNVLAFECKDALFYMSLQSSDDYKFVKVLNSREEILLSSGINFMFVDGVYFNGCELFINNHEMLIVKKGESIADKTLDDLIEIAPELTMNCITKAFGQLYIFGNQGTILKSSVETNNENAIAVQTISAKKALSDAKQYTDEQYAILEARIAALEGVTTE